MPIIQIHDIDDPRLARYTDLQSERRSIKTADDTFIVEGGWCVQKLAQSNFRPRSVVVEEGRHEQVAAEFHDDVPLFVLSSDQIRQLVGFDFHRGILAEGIRPPTQSVTQLAVDPAWSDSSRREISLAVFGVSLADNLGSMIRTATALGINRLVTGPRTADPFSRRSIRVSMGTVFSQSIYQSNHPIDEIPTMIRRSNVRVVATTLNPDATPLDQFVFGTIESDRRPMMLIVGSEPDGLGREIESVVTDLVTIPMHLDTDSLNVSVAAAIFMYEMTKHRDHGHIAADCT
ncbi:TrmH family RNA methyltransferase [Rubripirellula reticaptiva]|uniref:23S rRNA (Guanosine-2'-O-)-methyltransferase RlmB n=1 Tax=Rubripirellula reticaptiva TaxID=2528013 RepID=A0A5C6EIG7_9BACT|nr:RNA methyltransferase [Rubripirellula reticaptiva]TWU48245.1 23S rRNA (guanosine-2'-O-)-methyltransferase RlmB [Rubripirellula reticaptiva]